MISTRNRFRVAMLIFVFGGLFFVGILNEFHIGNLKLISLGWLLIWTFLLFQIRCPNCGKPVVYQGTLSKISVFAGFSNHSCKSCGYDLTNSN